MVQVCDVCLSNRLYCDRHDADFCPACDTWASAPCGDSECPYCPGRPARPSECDHPDRHYDIYSD